jgi:hypothetical protein
MPKALLVEIFGNAKQFGSELDKAAGKTAKFAQFAKLGGAAIAAGLAVGLEKSIEAGEKLQKAQDSLSEAIKHTGGNAQLLMAQYNKTAQAAAQYGINQTDATTALARATLLTGNAAAAQRAYQEAIVISKATGKDLNSVLTATSKGQDGITTSLQRYGIEIKKGTDGQTQFNDVMSRFQGQAKANTTESEKLSANLSNLSANIGKALLPAFNAIVSALNNVVVWTEANWPKLKQAIMPTIQGIWTATKPILDALKGLWSEFGGTIKTLVKNDFEAVGQYIRGVLEVFKGVIDIIKGIADGKWSLVWKGIKEVVGGTFSAITAILDIYIKDFAAIMTKIGAGMKNALVSALSGIGDAVAGIIKAPINAIIAAIDSIKLPSGIHIKTWHGIPDGFSVDWSTPFNIPQLAAGGIVTSPTLAMIGEAGPEAVVPLDQGGGLGMTLNITVNGWVGNDRALARRIRDELVSLGRSEPNIFAGFA